MLHPSSLRGRATAIACAAVVAITARVGSSPAIAAPNLAWPVCNFGTHPTAHQFTANLYLGENGVSYTFQPNVPSLTTQFSLWHLYPMRDNYDPWVEVGWYRGYGPEKIATNTSYFTAKHEIGGIYIEHDFEDVPNNTAINYQLENTGFNPITGKYIWKAYARNDFVNPLFTWEVGSINWARGLSGTEASGAGIEEHGWTQASHQLLLPTDHVWHPWTQALMDLNNDGTTTCADPGLTLGYNTYFDNFVVTGTSQ
jgi:hypothetical protein